MLFLLLLLICQCGPPQKQDLKKDRYGLRPPKTVKGSVTADCYRLTTSLRVSAIDSFARLSHRQRQIIEDLKKRPPAPIILYILDGRILAELPPSHPAGPAELLLAEDLDSLTLFRPSRKEQIHLPRHRLADLLEGRMTSLRSSFEMSFIASNQHLVSRRGLDQKIKTRQVSAQIAMRYYPQRGKPLNWSLQLRFGFLIADQPSRYPFQQPLLHWALPLLQSSRGLLVLESLAAASGRPLAWSTTVDNEGNPNSITPTFITRVESLGAALLPAARFEDTREGFRSYRALRAGSSGGQRISPHDLAPLRVGKVEGTLTINNQSAFAAIIYIDGLKLGWVGPKTSFSFQGLPSGYYRVFAISSMGIRRWGPFDLYVPGPLSLL